jgi:hypothetical protein
VVVVVDVVTGAAAVWVWVTVVDEVGSVTVSVRVALVADSVRVTVAVGLDELLVVEVDEGAAAAVFARSVVVAEVVVDADCDRAVSLLAGGVVELVALLAVVEPVLAAPLVCVRLELRLLLRLCPAPEPHAPTKTAQRAKSGPVRRAVDAAAESEPPVLDAVSLMHAEDDARVIIERLGHRQEHVSQDAVPHHPYRRMRLAGCESA